MVNSDILERARNRGSNVDGRAARMAGRFDIETTTIGELLDDPEARTIIDDLVPDLPDHPMIGLAKGMPVGAVLKMAGDQLPADVLEQLTSRIGAL